MKGVDNKNIELENPDVENTENEEENEKEIKKGKRKIRRRNIIIVVLTVIIILLLLRCCNGCPCGDRNTDITGRLNNFLGLTVDDGAEKTIEEDKEALVEEMNKKLEAGLMTLSVNTSPTFNTKGETSNFNIVNKEENHYPQLFEIYMCEEGNQRGEMIHRTGLIPVGTTLNKLTLDKPLPAGNYKLIALCYGMNEQTMEPLGMVQTLLDVVVK